MDVIPSDRDIRFALYALLFAICITLLAGSIALWTNSHRCERRAQQLKLEHRWTVLQGCFVHVDRAWIPIKLYRVVMD